MGLVMGVVAVVLLGGLAHLLLLLTDGPLPKRLLAQRLLVQLLGVQGRLAHAVVVQGLVEVADGRWVGLRLHLARRSGALSRPGRQGRRGLRLRWPRAVLDAGDIWDLGRSRGREEVRRVGALRGLMVCIGLRLVRRWVLGER